MRFLSIAVILLSASATFAQLKLIQGPEKWN